ncbi:MAG: ATP-binding protein [Chloroflexota bacterium]
MKIELNLDVKLMSNIFENIFHNSRDSIFFLTLEGKIVICNDTAVKFFGFAPEILSGLPLWEAILLPDFLDQFTYAYSDWIKSPNLVNETNTSELYVRIGNNGYCPVELTLHIIPLNGENYVCCSIRDITEKIIAQEENDRLIEEMALSRDLIEQNASEVVMLNSKLAESEIQLQELNSAKDKFFSIIAHDLKGPFQSLLGYSDVLKDNLDFLEPDETREIVFDLNTTAHSLFKLLENLLQWSRIQRGAIEYTPDNVPLYLLVRQNHNLIIQRLKEKSITFKEAVSEETYVYADVNMLNTVIRNLLSNAIKFTRAGGEISIYTDSDDKYIFLSVADNGVGIDPKVIPDLFKIDKNTTTEGTANEKGHGLGLVLCKDLTEKNKGELKVSSEPGVGTTFTIALPKGVKPEDSE